MSSVHSVFLFVSIVAIIVAYGHNVVVSKEKSGGQSVSLFRTRTRCRCAVTSGGDRGLYRSAGQNVDQTHWTISFCDMIRHAGRP